MKKLSVFRRLLLSLICLILCVSVCGCLTTADYELMYDDNVKIASSSTNLLVGSVESSLGDVYNWRCTSFSGVYPIKNINTDKAIKLKVDVEEGKFKIVATDGDAVYKLAEGDFDGEIDFASIPKGNFVIKAVGVEAKFSLKINS